MSSDILLEASMGVCELQLHFLGVRFIGQSARTREVSSTNFRCLWKDLLLSLIGPGTVCYVYLMLWNSALLSGVRPHCFLQLHPVLIVGRRRVLLQ